MLFHSPLHVAAFITATTATRTQIESVVKPQLDDNVTTSNCSFLHFKAFGCVLNDAK